MNLMILGEFAYELGIIKEISITRRSQGGKKRIKNEGWSNSI
jgi:hypothetical protein